MKAARDLLRLTTVAPELDGLRRAIRVLHGFNCTHFASVPVRETHAGRVVWDGTVEVFASIGKVRRIFAWHDGDRVVVVLGVPPIATPRDAVHATIAAAASPVRRHRA